MLENSTKTKSQLQVNIVDRPALKSKLNYDLPILF